MSTKTILVVDDSPTMRVAIRTELEEGGYSVIEAADGIKALAMTSQSSKPDLITLDIEMPKLNGFETCSKLHEKNYSRFFTDQKNQWVPIIFVTGNDTFEDRRKGFEVGAADFITKPFAKGELLSAVNKILKPEYRLEGMTALVVEDTQTVRNIISDCLTREGISVIDCEDGVQAFDILCQRKKEINIVITDLIMPRMGGDELCKKIRGELHLLELPIILTTAVPDRSHLLSVYKAGATDYIVKPFVKEELLARFNMQLERAKFQKNLQEANNRMKRELEIAKHLQQHMLPKRCPESHFYKIYTYYSPMEELGGDFYDFYVYSEKKILFMICDVSGHGTSASLVTAMQKAIFNDICARFKTTGEIITQLNRALYKILNKSDYFLSVFCGIVNLEENVLQYTNSGHPKPILLTKNGVVNLLPPGKQDPATGFFNNVDFNTLHENIEQGDKILIYTDGVIETMDSSKELWGIENLIDTVKRNAGLGSEDLIKKILESLTSFSGNGPQTDDITMTVIDIVGPTK